MLSAGLDNSGSPRKRTLSRGISEDESLRSIIKEAENSSRRLTRSESRTGTLKRRSDSQHSNQDLFMGLPEMLELQASYEEAVQELRGLEVQREALLFQVDVLQDTLEGVEELLAEAQREAGHANMELERERQSRRKLEDLVSALMNQVATLKEEVNSKEAEAVGHRDAADGSVRRQLKEDTEESLGRNRLAGGVEDEGNVQPVVRRLVGKPVAHAPSLALDTLVQEDGVLQRPYEHDCGDGPDPSLDQNDSDSISAYEDASADTPELDRIFTGGAPELPHDDDAADVASSATSNGSTHDPKNPEACVVS
ncbi:uncharacterized protein ACB058_006203 [Synchiropus picturatus]